MNVLVFIAGIAFNHFWPRFVKWAEPNSQDMLNPKIQSYPGKYTVPDTRTTHPPLTVADTIALQLEKLAREDQGLAPKPIDKRRRGVAEMRHIAEQESLKTERHQDEVTAKNIKAMQ